MKMITALADLKEHGQSFTGWIMIDPEQNWNYCLVPTDDLLSIPISSLPQGSVTNYGNAPIVSVKLA